MLKIGYWIREKDWKNWRLDNFWHRNFTLKVRNWHFSLAWFKSIHIFLFRDNGITVQLMKYQLYTETFVFLLNFFLVFLPSERDILTIRIIGILNTFMTFVIYPLFYLSGDVNFRNRVLHKGLWLAIKTELFSSTSLVAPSFM